MNFASRVLIVSGMLLTACSSWAADKPRNSNATVHIDISVSSTNPPKFYGTTNLPDGLLPYALRGDIPGCTIQCGFAGSADIHNGKFSFIVGMPDTDAPIEPDSYTLDIITLDNSKTLEIPFGDPTDPLHTVRFTARIIVSRDSAHIVKASVRFLPFRMDQKYVDDEIAHGHGVPQ